MPPRLATFLLRELLPEPHRECMLGDLVEEYERFVLPERGKIQAGVWFWVQALRSIPGAARLRLAARARSTSRPTRRGGSMRDLWQDVRYGARLLWKSPLFGLVALATLVLGVGANTAIFAVIHGVLLRPLPFEEPERLVALWEKNPERNWMFNQGAPANVLDWRERLESFDDVTAHGWTGSVALSETGEPEMISAVQVLGNFFSVLGAPPLVGRTFEADETWAAESDVVVLSHGFWARRFGSDPSVVGRRIHLDGEPATVVGVMPDGFQFPSTGIDLWTPFGWDPSFRAEVWFRRAHFVWPVGRLKPGVSLEQARRELESVALRLEEEYPETNRAMGAGLTPLHEWIVGETRRPLLLLFTAVALVLLIACANIANLLLARASTRSQEIALRGALGAGRARLVRQLLAESALLGVLGGLLAILLASALLPVLLSRVPAEIPRLNEIRIGGEVLGFALLVSILTALAFGLVPAFQASGASLAAPVRAGGRGLSQRRTGLRQWLVIAEVALAVILTAGAGLLLKSFLRLAQAPAGFEAGNAWKVSLSLVDSRYPEEEDRLRFHTELLERFRAHPGVGSVASADHLPLTGLHFTTDFLFEGRPPEEVGVEFNRRRISPGYFRVMGVPLLSGRDFADSDRQETEPVAIVNETVARLYFPGTAYEEIVGTRIAFENEEPRRWLTIVGIAGDEKHESLHAPSRPEIFLPILQSPPWTLRYVFRFAIDSEAALRSIRSEIGELDPSLPLFEVGPLEALVSTSIARERFLGSLLGAFATLALLLSAVGIGGVVSYGVSQRRYEIGIRLALGARGGEIVRMIARQSFVPGAIGIGAGLAGAAAFSGILSGLLFEVSRHDAATLVLTALVTGTVTWLASYLPARRASRVSPITSLRPE